MANSIAELPVRTNKAPKEAQKAKTSPPPAPQPDPKPEWLVLGLQHARQLCELLYNLIDHHGMEEPPQGLVHELASTAESHLYALTHEDSHISTAKEGQLYGEISMVVTMLKAAEHCAVHSSLGYPSNIHAAVLPSAVAYAQALMEALQAAPDDVTPLVRLDAKAVMGTTSAGVRPHREQPRPPIRRIEDHPQDLMQQAIMFGDLVQWIVGSRDTLDTLRWGAMNHPILKEELRRLEISYGYPEWGNGLASQGLDWLLNEQHVTIKALGAKAGAA